MPRQSGGEGYGERCLMGYNTMACTYSAEHTLLGASCAQPIGATVVKIRLPVAEQPNCAKADMHRAQIPSSKPHAFS